MAAVSRLVTIKRERLHEYISDSIWSEYYNGIEAGDKWQDGCISGAESLERELGLKLHVWHNAETVKDLIPLLIERKISEAIDEALAMEFSS